MYLAENLKFLREQNGKTQGELAVLFGIEQKTISSWECGSRKPPIGTIVSLAKLYRVCILEELSKIATDYGIIHNGSLLQEITREELIRRCSERIELTLDHPKQAIPVMDSMGFTNYQVTDKEHIHIFERLNESAALNMELAKSGIPVKGISITSEELETYFLNLTGGADHA